MFVNDFTFFVLFCLISCLGNRKSIRSHGSVHIHHPLGHLRRHLSRVEVGARQLPLCPLRPRRFGLPGQDHVQPRQRGEGGVRQVRQGLISFLNLEEVPVVEDYLYFLLVCGDRTFIKCQFAF